MYVTNVVNKVVGSSEDFTALMSAGMKNRTTGATKMNDRSSRSHLIMIIDVEQHNVAGSTVNWLARSYSASGSLFDAPACSVRIDYTHELHPKLRRAYSYSVPTPPPV